MVAEEIKERIKLHLFKIQILEIPARKVFKDRGSNLGRRFLSTININGIESNGIKSELLTLDIFFFMRMDYGAWERKMGDGLYS